jgi:hypothetical protein
MKLQDKLDKLKTNFVSQAPKEALEIMQRATRNLMNSGITEQAVKIGGTAPDFELTSADGKVVRLKERLSSGPLVLCFYRGKW